MNLTLNNGSTGVACINTKRNFIGIEKDDKYFEIAKKRIEQPSNNFIHEMYCELNQREQHNGSMMNVKPWK